GMICHIPRAPAREIIVSEYALSITGRYPSAFGSLFCASARLIAPRYWAERVSERWTSDFSSVVKEARALWTAGCWGMDIDTAASTSTVGGGATTSVRSVPLSSAERSSATSADCGTARGGGAVAHAAHKASASVKSGA